MREEGTDHTKLFFRIFTGFGLTWHQEVNFSTFDGKHFITEWSQNLPYGPNPRGHKTSIFYIYISHYPFQKQKNDNQDLGFPIKIHEFSLK